MLFRKFGFIILSTSLVGVQNIYANSPCGSCQAMASTCNGMYGDLEKIGAQAGAGADLFNGGAGQTVGAAQSVGGAAGVDSVAGAGNSANAGAHFGASQATFESCKRNASKLAQQADKASQKASKPNADPACAGPLGQIAEAASQLAQHCAQSEGDSAVSKKNSGSGLGTLAALAGLGALAAMAMKKDDKKPASTDDKKPLPVCAENEKYDELQEKCIPLDDDDDDDCPENTIYDAVKKICVVDSAPDAQCKEDEVLKEDGKCYLKITDASQCSGDTFWDNASQSCKANGVPMIGNPADLDAETADNTEEEDDDEDNGRGSVRSYGGGGAGDLGDEGSGAGAAGDSSKGGRGFASFQAGSQGAGSGAKGGSGGSKGGGRSKEGAKDGQNTLNILNWKNPEQPKTLEERLRDRY